MKELDHGLRPPKHELLLKDGSVHSAPLVFILWRQLADLHSEKSNAISNLLMCAEADPNDSNSAATIGLPSQWTDEKGYLTNTAKAVIKSAVTTSGIGITIVEPFVIRDESDSQVIDSLRSKLFRTHLSTRHNYRRNQGPIGME